MEQNSYSATGRRKAAVARVDLREGKGNFLVNGKPISDFLCRETLVAHAREPLDVTEMRDAVDVHCTAKGGGIRGQAGAIRLGVARALVSMNQEFHQSLRQGGFLTRDAREVERKKYGQPKARKRFQYSKR
ncbi:MAG: 30S ribosomal protein S9 [candidate division Zixibacteria bacterium]|nr:30S ribosomal protein S9 [candidate division Zixibacteria bacterium]